jgi:hypothetical protein
MRALHSLPHQGKSHPFPELVASGFSRKAA